MAAGRTHNHSRNWRETRETLIYRQTLYLMLSWIDCICLCLCPKVTSTQKFKWHIVAHFGQVLAKKQSLWQDNNNNNQLALDVSSPKKLIKSCSIPLSTFCSSVARYVKNFLYFLCLMQRIARQSTASKKQVTQGGRVRVWSSQCESPLIFPLFECWQSVHLKKLCWQYPWTINLLVMYNMGPSVRPQFHFRREKGSHAPWVKKWHFFYVYMMWTNNIEGHHYRRAYKCEKTKQNCVVLNTVCPPDGGKQHKETYCFGCYLKEEKKRNTSGPDHGGGKRNWEVEEVAIVA